MTALTKQELIAKLERFPNNAKVYVGGQYREGAFFSIYATRIIDVESAPIVNVPEILLIEEEE